MELQNLRMCDFLWESVSSFKMWEDKLSLMKWFSVTIFIFAALAEAGALEVDEKMTLRVLRTSSSKKTVLINRGLEDGLAEGDHAKFYLTTGVVARAVLTKVSPSRSIWSVYRLVDPDKLVLDKVMNLKIATPVKLTRDKSRMLSPDNEADAPVIPIAPGADDLPGELGEDEKQDLAGLSGDSPALSIGETAGINAKATLEAMLLIQFTGLSSSTDRGTEGTSSASETAYDVTLGIEKYFPEPKTWYHRFSVFFLVHGEQKSVSQLEGSSISLTSIEYGAGFNWHFLADPMAYNRLIGHFSMGLGIGKSEEAFTDNTSGSSNTQPFSGSSTYFTVGLGLKYYLSRGFGFRGIFDYYRRGERYSIQDQSADFSRTVAGPRLLVGLAYRW